MNPNNPSIHLLATVTQWLLLCVAAIFGSIFIYNILSPISAPLALLLAVAIIGLNFAEGYLVRFAIAAWRFGFNKVALIASIMVIAISAYSLLAGFNVVESYLAKNQRTSLATDYDIAAAKQRIKAAQSESFNSFDFSNREANYMNTAAAENEKIAALLRQQPASNSSVSPSTAATFVAIAIEAAIIGLTAFIELFLRPTPLPALVKFNDKLVEWGLNDEKLQNLTITASPSAGTVALPNADSQPPRLERSHSGGLEVLPECVFEEWLEAVLRREVRPVLKDSKFYLRNQHGYKIEYAQDMATEYLERAYNMGHLTLNDNKGPFDAQYILVNNHLLEQGA